MQKEEPPVAVIVLNYNGAAYVNRCLHSIFRNHYSNFEVIFVDNNSSDGSVELASNLFSSNPRFTIIQNSKNFGFSMGNNIGFRHAKGKYVIVLNNDAEVQRSFISELVTVAESDEKIGSVGCKIVQLDGSIRYGPVYMNQGFIVNAHSPKTYDKFTINLANCGCAALYRKSVIGKIGGFDPIFWADWEDHDLGYRMNLSGFKSVYTPKTTVLHLGGGLSLGISKEWYMRIIRNILLTYVKNYEVKNLILRLPLVIIISTAKRVLWVTVKKKMCFFLFHWFFDFLKKIRSILIARKSVQRLRVVSDNYIFKTTKIPERMS